MAARFNTRFKKDLFDIGRAALDALENYSWPGNIRQLENCMQQTVLVSSGPELLFEHLPQQIREQLATGHVSKVPVAQPDSLIHNREVVERNVIQRALASNGNSRSRAAEALGISRVTLYKKMKKYGLMETPTRNGE
jgi:DNA-binding NtrC family response regulator